MESSGAQDLRLPELVRSIYEAGMEPERWPRVLDDAVAHFGARIGMLWTHDFSTNSIYRPNAQLSCMAGVDDAGAGAFKSHYYAMNVWVPRSANLQEGCTVLSSELYPESQLERTEFYADWLRPLDLFHAIGSAVIKDASRHVKLSFVRPRRAGAFDPGERRRLAFLLPHVRNAFLLHRQFGHLRALAHSACAALDCLAVGVVLLARSGEVLHANEAAKRAVESTRALKLSGAMACAVPSETAALRKLVADAVLTGGGAGLRSGGAMKLRGLAGEMHVVVTPLHSKDEALTDLAAAVMFCTVPGQPLGEVAHVLGKVHQLTQAESAVACGLMQGLSLREIAERRSSSVNTVRSQLKSICAKTGARRQADLVRVLFESIPLVRGVSQ